jgi:hypothetical protein
MSKFAKVKKDFTANCSYSFNRTLPDKTPPGSSAIRTGGNPLCHSNPEKAEQNRDT